MGSPKTHKWKWDFYTPHLQICEIFPHTNEGWEQALEVERRIIRQDLDKKHCLNERCGGHTSIELSRKGGRVTAERNLKLRLGIFRPGYFGSKEHKQASSSGGKLGGSRSKPNLKGCSLGGKSGGRVSGMNHKLLGRGIFSEEYLNSKKCKETGLKAADSLHKSKWMDPDHPELGCHHVQTLKRLQKERGYPSEKTNRVKCFST